ncbi:MAG: hypothetical protein IKU07_09265 [Oscillospiraceae bacterium]|nr:hypothetical protein [Oscillospiraceae bacterium]
MSVKDREDKIFTQWRNLVKKDSSAFFVTDGIVNEDAWKKASIRVLYLLKEVNGADDEWDERDYLANYNNKDSYIKTHSPTIDVLIKWQFGIVDAGQSSWNEVEKEILNKELQSDLLKQICLVNIKKTAGGGIVNWEQFDAYFANTCNHDFLRQQLCLYNPQVVICGGTAWHLCQIKGWEYSNWKQTSRGIRYFVNANTTYIDFCHPNNRGPKNMIYYALMDALKELNII